MPKNKQVLDESDPEALKQVGNKAFQAGKFEEAVESYSKAIELNPNNHIYFANSKSPNINISTLMCIIFVVGANAYLEWNKLEECIADADRAI
jgi:tetratricopeptide (TPR) repeat protein